MKYPPIPSTRSTPPSCQDGDRAGWHPHHHPYSLAASRLVRAGVGRREEPVMQLLWRLRWVTGHGENVQAGVGPYHVTLVAGVVVARPRAGAGAVGELVRSALTSLIACPVLGCAGDGILEGGIHVRRIVILVILHARGIASSRGRAPNGGDHAGHSRLRGKGAARAGEG